MADVIKQMNDQYDRVMEAGVRKDFGQGLDDVDKDSLLKAVKMVHFPDMDQEDYLSALGQAYGGISIKKPETQRVLGHDFQPNSEQMNVPVLPEVNVTAKGYSHGAVPKTVHSLAGSLAYDLASLPANLASTVRSMAQDISDFHTGKPLRTAADMAPEIEKAKEAGATLGSFVAPELKYAPRGEAMVREGGKFVSRYLVEPVVNKFLDHTTKFGASQGAIYSGVTAIGEGDSPMDIAKKTLLGGGFGAVLGKAGHNVGLSVKAFREGLSGVQHKAAEALATAGTTPIASTLDRIIKRGLTPTMEHSFADVLGLLKKGRIAASDAAQQILEGLGQKPAPEHVAAFTEHLRHMEPVAPDTFGQHAEDTGMADWHMPGEVPPVAPDRPAPFDPFANTGQAPLEEIPAADIGYTPTEPPDQFGQHTPADAAPIHLPGDVEPQRWSRTPDQVSLDEQVPGIHDATVQQPTSVPQKVLDSQVNYPQGYIPWEPSQFNFEGLTPAEQYNLVSRRVAEDAKLRADTGIGPQEQKLLPGGHTQPTGAESNPDLPIWGITTDKISMDGLAIVGEKDADTYIARDHNGMEVEIPKKQTFDPDLKGPDSSIPVPGKGKTDSEAQVSEAIQRLAKKYRNPITNAQRNAAKGRGK